jgi:pimeloyl-ACP methyl ester carboxylesterase
MQYSYRDIVTEIRKLIGTFSIALPLIILTIFGSAFLNPVNGQTLCDNGNIVQSSTALPVILVHGYAEDSSVWSTWEQLLAQDNIPFCTITFHQSSTPNGDECGSAADHATELAQIVQEVKNMTGQDKVNIVAHSKGGLDARVYLANTNTADVPNLIMIGTPNEGDPIEDQLNLFDPCTPAADDLKTFAPDTMAGENTHTHYYNIDGNWKPPATFEIPWYVWNWPDSSWNFYDQSFSVDPAPSNCPQIPPDWLGFQIRGYSFLTVEGFGNNDGIVPESATTLPYSLPYSSNIGSTDDCHTNLLSQKSFGIAEPYLLG